VQEIPEPTKEQRKDRHKLNKKTLTEYLSNFASKFGDSFSQLDELWKNADADSCGVLDPEECKVFMEEVSKIINPDLA